MTDTADLIGVDSLLSDEEKSLRADVRSFVDTAIKPNIAEWYENAVFPALLTVMMKLGRWASVTPLLTDTLWGCPSYDPSAGPTTSTKRVGQEDMT